MEDWQQAWVNIHEDVHILMQAESFDAITTDDLVALRTYIGRELTKRKLLDDAKEKKNG